MKTFAKHVLGYISVIFFGILGGILLIPAIGVVACIYLGNRAKCKLLDKHLYDFSVLLRNFDKNLVCTMCKHEATEEEINVFRGEPKLAPVFIIRDIALEMDAAAKKQQEVDITSLQNEPIVAVQRSALEGQ